MAHASKLNPEILEFLSEKLQRRITTIRPEISRLRQDYQQSTLNAVAQLYAQQHRLSVRKFLSKEDKSTIPRVRFEHSTPVLKLKRGNPREQKKEVFHLETADQFVKKHIDEINRAYSKKCYTCVFVLSRKVFENLIIGILRAKFPAEPQLYLDVSKGRNHDFSVVLDNLFKHRTDFDTDKKNAIDRLNQKLKHFKDDANDKAHSLYHVVENAREVDDWNLDTIVALIDTITKGL